MKRHKADHADTYLKHPKARTECSDRPEGWRRSERQLVKQRTVKVSRWLDCAGMGRGFLESLQEPCCPAAEWPSASERSDAVSDHFAAAAAVQSWTLQTCGQADVTLEKQHLRNHALYNLAVLSTCGSSRGISF